MKQDKNELKPQNKINKSIIITRMALFLSLIIISTFIRIPIVYGNFFTMQLFFITLCGMFLGAFYGGLTVCLYLIIGLLGLPIFAGGGGFFYVLKPSFGFLLGFIANVFIMGIILRKNKNLVAYFIACYCGIIINYILGIAYQYFVLTYLIQNSKVALITIILSYVPFILPCDIVMTGIAAYLGYKMKKYSIA